MKKLNKKHLSKMQQIDEEEERETGQQRQMVPQKPTIKKKVVLWRKVEIYGGDGNMVIIDK